MLRESYKINFLDTRMGGTCLPAVSSEDSLIVADSDYRKTDESLKHHMYAIINGFRQKGPSRSLLMLFREREKYPFRRVQYEAASVHDVQVTQFVSTELASCITISAFDEIRL